MVGLHCKSKMLSSDFSSGLHVHIPPPPTSSRGVTSISPVPASDSACSTYEQYLRLPELRNLWSDCHFLDWKNEPVLKPALHALEITFRFVSTVLSDPRPYANKREWKRRLESLAAKQIQLIAVIIEDEAEDAETCGTAPLVDLSSVNGVLERESSYAEVWKYPGGNGTAVMVNRASEGSLLPPLGTWHTSEDVAQKIMYSIECEMRRCPYTLGLGEPNLDGKPNLDYDAVCRPSELHSLKRNPYNHQIENQENQSLYTAHQVLESWIHVAKQIMSRLTERIENQKFEAAANDCYLLEHIWKLLAEIEDLHLLMDPDDFLKLKNQLSIRSETEPFCFRSRSLVEFTRKCKELKHKVPEILEVEVDPKGGPRIQEAAMRLYTKKSDSEKIHLLQGLQAVEAAVKRFFYSYKQVVVAVMGSLEAKGNSAVACAESNDSLTRLLMEPTYFPSLDAAKTFLGQFHEQQQNGEERRNRKQ